MTRRRALDWVLIVALTVVWALLFARGLGEGLRTGYGKVGVTASSARDPDSYPFVIGERGGGSPRSGLEVGDQLVGVDGEDLRGRSALFFQDRVTRAARERGFATIRATRRGTPLEMRLELTPIPWWWAQMLFAAPVFLIGLLVLVRVPQWHLARRNFVLLACLSGVGASFDWKTDGFRGTSLDMVLGPLVLMFTVGLYIWNLQDFTRSARPVPRLHRGLAIAAAIGGTMVYWIRNWLPDPRPMESVFSIPSALFAAAVCTLALVRAYRRSDPLERRQIRWVVVGAYFNFVGAASAVVWSWIPGWRTASGVLGAFNDLGIPVGMLISVIGYRWLDVDRLISAATSYTILGLVFVGASLAAIPASSQAAAPVLGLAPVTLQWLLTLGLVLAAIPAHAYLWPRIDRRMFVERNRRMLGFARLLDEIGSYASAPELVRMAGERVDALLEPESIAVYARGNARFTAVFARGAAMSKPAFEADSLLVRALEQRSQPLSAQASELDAFDRAALETLGVELIVPIHGHTGVAGFACLGRKRSGDIYTPQEIAHLGAVATRCSEVLLRLAEPPPAVVSEPAAQVFRRDGEFWTIASAGKEIRLRDMRGLHYLAALLREPGREFAATDLVRFANRTPLVHSPEDPALSVVRGLGDAGERLDARARAAYRERLREIEAERAEAERHGDLGRLGRASEEREALLAELVAAARGRRAASHAERARVAVTKRIKAALEKIGERHPELGDHLSATIRRGYLCSYVPDPRIPSDWDT